MILATKAALGGSSLTYRWVAVGNTGALATSDSATASSWTSRTSSFGTTKINYVASNGFDLYVAVGDAGKLATSPDGITWTQRTSTFGTNTIRGVVYGGGYWVAVGGTSTPVMATSTDGITWTANTGTGFTGTYIQKVGYGAGLFLASGGQTRTASNPTGAWTDRTTGNTTDFQHRWTPAKNIWTMGIMAIGASNQINSSPDGITWTLRTLPNSPSTTTARVTSNDSVIVVAYQTAAANCDIASSTDGIGWTDRTPAITATVVAGSSVDSSGFMVFANGTNVQTSTDGTTWTSRTGPAFTPLALCHSSNA